MSDFNIKPTHKPIKTYYDELEKYAQHGAENEGTVRAAFQNLLQPYCHQSDLTLLCEKTHYTAENRRIQPDGEVVDTYGLPHGYWEAKDPQDNLYAEADKKFAAGYPSKNIVVQSPTHALLYQHGRLQLDLDITDPRNLVHVLQTFFAYQEENISAWHTADPPELQCNEVMLLPYYIANLNIEHEFYTATHRYVPYEGLCLVDTFQLACGEDEALERQNLACLQRFPDAWEHSVKNT